MSKNKIMLEHVVVTFFEAAVAYLVVIPTVSWGKTVVAGALGAGLSAVYNVLRQSNPTVFETTAPAPPEQLLNGVTELAPPKAPVQGP